jgi:hypothetical protein
VKYLSGSIRYELLRDVGVPRFNTFAAKFISKTTKFVESWLLFPILGLYKLTNYKLPLNSKIKLEQVFCGIRPEKFAGLRKFYKMAAPFYTATIMADSWQRDKPFPSRR